MQNKSYQSLYTELMCSETMENFSQCIHSLIRKLGFTDYLFVRTNRHWRTESSYGLLHTMPDKWLRDYQQECLFKYDLTIPYTRVNTQPIFSSQIYNYINNAPFDIALTQKNRLIIQLYKKFNYFEHCCIPQVAVNGSGCVMLQISSEGLHCDEFQSKITPHISILRYLCCAIDEVSTKKFAPLFIEQHDNPVVIAKKPLQSLRMLARSDITINELASRLYVSHVTAHHYIASARQALGVKTNIAAIIKAVKLGLIDLD